MIRQYSHRSRAFLECTLKTRRGTIYRLGDVGKTNAYKIEQTSEGEVRHLPFLNSLSVGLAMNFLTEISIGLDIPYHEGIELLESDFFEVGSMVTCRFGFDQDEMTRVFVAYNLQGAGGIQISPDGVSGTLTLEANNQGLVYSSVKKRGKGQSIESYAKSFVERPYRIEFTQKASETLKKHSRSNTYEFNGKVSPIKAVSEFSKTFGLDYRLINESTREITIEIFDNHEKSQLPADQDEIIALAIRSDFAHPQYNNEKVFPLLSFQPDGEIFQFFTMDAFTKAEENKATSSTVNRQGKVETSKATPKDTDLVKPSKKMKDQGEDAQVDSTETSVKPKEKQTGVQKTPKSSENESPKDSAKDAVKKALSKSYKASVSTVGLPTINVSHKIRILGVSKRLEGLFTIETINHTWNGGSIETQMTIYGTSHFELRQSEDD